MCWTPLCTKKHKSHGTQKVTANNRTTQNKLKKMRNTPPQTKTKQKKNKKKLGVISDAHEG